MEEFMRAREKNIYANAISPHPHRVIDPGSAIGYKGQWLIFKPIAFLLLFMLPSSIFTFMASNSNLMALNIIRSDFVWFFTFCYRRTDSFLLLSLYGFPMESYLVSCVRFLKSLKFNWNIFSWFLLFTFLLWKQETARIDSHSNTI